MGPTTSATCPPPPARITVTDADLAVLRTPFLPSGYHNVYHKQRGRSALWQARPYSSGGGYDPGRGGGADGRGGAKGRCGPRVLLGTFRSPRDAAKAVVAWYKGQFGDGWADVYRSRTRNPWFARAVAGGWELVVRGAVLPRPAGGAFPTRAEASAYFRAWARATYGEDAGVALRAAPTAGG